MARKRNLNRIREVIEEKGIKRVWVAEKMGVHKATVSAWCSNIAHPQLEKLVELARLLEVAPADLIVDGRKKEIAPEATA